ncbi:hypothetical protein M430DRAFT_175463 [Amorphotheca resinae ATCC 22711]|uniref:Uncharacterized protein n=1 Tax=Amorphotheca resinae ATCC 22711 TaxID=857342 RepID=A0A2T3AST4_AMORE|nr:hypothetical protein M430DRAFT_175463 [Amorphotheca resinae ATCC 22711]PSS10522.1 hypothetical protein M430DRAFT_175463 [Amorphotheca resinae ATCC 22711]
MDVPGMFGLSRIPAVPLVRFVSPRPGDQLNKYVNPVVRETIMKATRRRSDKEWSPTGLENPSPRSPVPWTVLAERRRRRTETVARCHRHQTYFSF